MVENANSPSHIAWRLLTGFAFIVIALAFCWQSGALSTPVAEPQQKRVPTPVPVDVPNYTEPSPFLYPLFVPCKAPCRYEVSSTLGEVVDNYGPPTAVIAYIVRRGEYDDLAYELYYVSIGLIVIAGKRADGVYGVITRDTEASAVWFWRSRTMRAWYEELSQARPVDALHLSLAHEWTGFGSIEFADLLKPPRSP